MFSCTAAGSPAPSTMQIRCWMPVRRMVAVMIRAQSPAVPTPDGDALFFRLRDAAMAFDSDCAPASRKARPASSKPS